MTGKEKYHRFQRIAPARTQRVLEALDALGNCANPASYLYSTQDAQQLMAVIEEKSAAVRRQLESRTHRPPFRLSSRAAQQRPGDGAGIPFMGKSIHRSQLCTKAQILSLLARNGACFTSLEPLRNKYMHQLGIDPFWTYPLGTGSAGGLVIVPVQEGILSLPYMEVDSETYEQFCLEDAELLDTQALHTLLVEFTSYASGLTAALTDMRQMLQTGWNTPSDT